MMTGFERIRATIAGGHPLRGTYGAPGAKNAVLPMLAASLLAEEGKTILHRVPPVKDVLVGIEMLRRLGAKVDYDVKESVVVIDAWRWLGGPKHPLLQRLLRVIEPWGRLAKTKPS